VSVETLIPLADMMQTIATTFKRDLLEYPETTKIVHLLVEGLTRLGRQNDKVTIVLSQSLEEMKVPMKWTPSAMEGGTSYGSRSGLGNSGFGSNLLRNSNFSIYSPSSDNHAQSNVYLPQSGHMCDFLNLSKVGIACTLHCPLPPLHSSQVLRYHLPSLFGHGFVAYYMACEAFLTYLITARQLLYCLFILPFRL
jgi:hypothetical protein